MEENTDNTGEDDIDDINKIFALWPPEKTLIDIAAETGLRIEVVNRKLKKILRALVENES